MLQELEKEALMNDLTRRTVHKCSIDDEALAGREHRQLSKSALEQEQLQVGWGRGADSCNN